MLFLMFYTVTHLSTDVTHYFSGQTPKVELLSHVSRDVNLRKKKSSKLVGGMFKWEGTGVNLWLIHADVL